jgi:hypothetical protein
VLFLHFSFQLFQQALTLVKTARNVEATLPLATFEGQQHLATTIQVAIPLGILLIAEV